MSATHFSGPVYIGGVAVNAVPETLAAANTITAAESGKTFFLGLAGGFANTLPAPAAGLKYKFVVAVAPTSVYTVVADAAVVEGIVDVNDTLLAIVNGTTITFAANVSLIGDWIEVESDGTSWFITGQTIATVGITAA